MGPKTTEFFPPLTNTLHFSGTSIFKIYKHCLLLLLKAILLSGHNNVVNIVQKIVLIAAVFLLEIC